MVNKTTVLARNAPNDKHMLDKCYSVPESPYVLISKKNFSFARQERETKKQF